jgi:hypothetical protein
MLSLCGPFWLWYIIPLYHFSLGASPVNAGKARVGGKFSRMLMKVGADNRVICNAKGEGIDVGEGKERNGSVLLQGCTIISATCHRLFPFTVDVANFNLPSQTVMQLLRQPKKRMFHLMLHQKSSHK